MDWHLFWGILAMVISMIGFIPYTWSILAKKTTPSQASWIAWAVAASVYAYSAFKQGASWDVLILQCWLLFAQTATAILCFWYGEKKWDAINTSSVSVSMIGFAAYLLTGEAEYSLLIAIVADALACVPNFRHLWSDPESEGGWGRVGWTLGTISALVELLAINKWTLAEAGFPIYYVIFMIAILILVWRPICWSKNKSNRSLPEME